ncbi:MAG: arylsulfatase [Phenylobacterium sp.]|uniref:arylsulfatase n=1 Tax=Phenylobacterium sp. TaxID=1871053 RepID=UPI001A4C570E|nr:arylsulfatase [Phenylobacterium sp.]MBL8555811.1 arylsulfatase [Phenylobacterium sp.]
MAQKIGRTVAESEPYWPQAPRPPKGAPNILVILFDDVGFSDFGCYGSPIRTPNIDRLAAEGLRYAGFHTTAMCSTTRAALLTGRNHHSVGMGCLANFDCGFPGYRGKLAREAATLPEMLRPHGYRNYMLGKWHVTRLTETGPTGPFDGWPLGRGFDRYYGFMDAETDQYAPELVRDNTPITPPGTYETGYHLTTDLTDEAIRYIADHTADAPDRPWLCWFAPGACHAPHQAPADLIRSYDAVFERGWDVEREERLARQKAMGLVPPDTKLPPRNDGVRPWDSHPEDERRLMTRLQSAFAAMLEHTDRHIGRLVSFLEDAGLRDDTIILVMSDNGASQEGGPLGFVNAMGPFNFRGEPMAEKIARIDDIGGPDTHSNFPHGWAMASNTPLRRYKQNTHGGGIRDPLVISWPKGIAARGEIRPHFAAACDLVPTLLDIIGIAPPAEVQGVKQMPLEGESFARSLHDAAAPPRGSPQYFEMFGHRGLWQDGWKAVAFHPPGSSFDSDVWELFHLDADFSESDDLAAAEPGRLAALVDEWWRQAQAHQVLPLDDRFGPRIVEYATRFQADRRRFVLHRGMGHLPTDVAPDVRARSYRIEADVVLTPGCEGVLIAHGDATSGYALYVKDGRLHHTLNVGGQKVTVSSDPLPPTATRLGVASLRSDAGPRAFTLLVDGRPAGEVTASIAFVTFISWSGLDVGVGRGSPVADYPAPFAFTGELAKVTVTLDTDQALDGDAVAEAEMARQ